MSSDVDKGCRTHLFQESSWRETTTSFRGCGGIRKRCTRQRGRTILRSTRHGRSRAAARTGGLPRHMTSAPQCAVGGAA
eukprot:4388572-Prymnesium_polylepis.1